MLIGIAQKVAALSPLRQLAGDAVSFSSLLLLPPAPPDVIVLKSERNKFLESDMQLQQDASRLYKQANRIRPPDYDIDLARTYYKLALLYFNYFNKPNALGVDLDCQKLNTEVAAYLNDVKRFKINHVDKNTQSKVEASLLFPRNSTLLEKALFLLQDADAMYDALLRPPNVERLSVTSQNGYIKEKNQILDLLEKLERIQVLPETEKLNEEALENLAKQQPEQALALLNKALALDEKAQPKAFYSWNVIRDKVNLGLTYYKLYQSACLEDTKKASDCLVEAYAAFQSGLQLLSSKNYRSPRGIAVANNNLGVIFAQSLQVKHLQQAVKTFKHSLVLINGLLMSPQEKPYDEELLKKLQQKIRLNLYYSLMKLRTKLDQPSKTEIDTLTKQIEELKPQLPKEYLVVPNTDDPYKMLHLLEYW